MGGGGGGGGCHSSSRQANGVCVRKGGYCSCCHSSSRHANGVWVGGGGGAAAAAVTALAGTQMVCVCGGGGCCSCCHSYGRQAVGCGVACVLEVWGGMCAWGVWWGDGGAVPSAADVCLVPAAVLVAPPPTPILPDTPRCVKQHAGGGEGWSLVCQTAHGEKAGHMTCLLPMCRLTHPTCPAPQACQQSTSA